MRQINTAMSWHTWQGETFRVSLSTLCRRKDHGGLALIHSEAKCRALILYRLQTLSQNARTTTAQWLKKWNLLQRSKNPPNRERIAATLDYLRLLETDSAYMVSQGKTVTVQTYRRRIRHYTDPYEYRDKTPQHAHRTALAEYRMAKNMEESVDSPSHRLNEDNTVQDYTHCPYKGTPPQNPYSSH